MKWSNGDSPGAADGSNRPRSRRDAIAIPTAEDRPCPSGPVVISTPLVWWNSGCPGVSEPQVRSASRSFSSRPKPARYSWMYNVNDECPADSTNRSRPTHVGSAGSCRITFWNRLYANGAKLIAVPGWPLPTFCTASAASTRTVSTALVSTSDQSSGTYALVRAAISAVAADMVTSGRPPGRAIATAHAEADRGTCLNRREATDRVIEPQNNPSTRTFTGSWRIETRCRENDVARAPASGQPF